MSSSASEKVYELCRSRKKADRNYCPQVQVLTICRLPSLTARAITLRVQVPKIVQQCSGLSRWVYPFRPLLGGHRWKMAPNLKSARKHAVNYRPQVQMCKDSCQKGDFTTASSAKIHSGEPFPQRAAARTASRSCIGRAANAEPFTNIYHH